MVGHLVCCQYRSYGVWRWLTTLTVVVVTVDQHPTPNDMKYSQAVLVLQSVTSQAFFFLFISRRPSLVRKTYLVIVSVTVGK